MGMRRGWICVFLFTVSMINYVDRVALSVASKPIATEFGLTPVDMGYMFSSFLWTYLVCLIPMGILVDRVGTKRLNAAGIALWSLATVVTGSAWSYVTLVATRLFMGVGEATTYPAGARVIREWIPAGERGLANAVFNSGAYAGPALGALVVAAIIDQAGWRASFYAVGAMGFVWLAAWALWYGRPETVSWLSSAERAKILKERNAESGALDQVSGAGRILDLLGTRTIWGLALTQSCAVYTQYLFLTWLPNYLQTTKNLTILRTGLFTAAPYAGAVVLGILLGTVSDRLLTGEGLKSGRRRLIVVASMLSSAVMLAAPFVDNTLVLLVLVTLSLTGISSAVSLNFALLNDLLQNPQDIGKAMSILIVGGNCFGIAAPIVTGYVIQGTGSYDWAFGIAGFLLVAGATISLTMTRRPIVLVPA